MRLASSLACFVLMLGIVHSDAHAADACSPEIAPAATLLLPYFEVDLASADGISTLFSINNSAEDPALAHVTLWSDLGIPVISFHVFLTGFDVQTINLRDVLNGQLPITADASTDFGDELSPSGLAGWDGDFEGCANFFPYSQPAIVGGLREYVRGSLTGQPTALDQGQCRGFAHESSQIARGYVTIDNVRRCTPDFPNEGDYFATNGNRIVSDVNQLWGDFFLVDPGQDSAQGEALVHIQAFQGTFAEGDYTFYGSLLGGSAADARESLPNSFSARYLNGGAFTGGTDLLIWRDPKTAQRDAFDCGDSPSWFPLSQGLVLVFDEQESWTNACSYFFDAPAAGRITPPPPPINCFPLASQRIGVDGRSATGDVFSAPFDFGWIHVPMDHFQGDDTYGGGAAQGWVLAIHQANGRFSVGLPALPTHSSCDGEAPSLF
ncbi:MAG: hypothetical protein AAGN66_01815 [Acidobacteriota bacterium]